MFGDPPRRQWVYMLMPCHQCNQRLWRQHPLYAGNLEVADEWRDQTELAMKLVRDENIRREEARRTASGIAATMPPPEVGFYTRLEPEEPSEPPRSDSTN